MIQELEAYEIDFQIAERKFLAKESAQNNKLEILELEKKNLLNRLEFFQKIYPSPNPYNKVYVSENERMQEELAILNDKLSIYQSLYIEMETILMKKTTPMNILDNLDTFAIKIRANELIKEIKGNRRESVNKNKLKNALKFNKLVKDIIEEKKSVNNNNSK